VGRHAVRRADRARRIKALDELAASFSEVRGDQDRRRGSSVPTRSLLEVGSLDERATQLQKVGGEYARQLSRDPVECEQQLALLMRR
jgi:hypothetical protein